MVSTGKVLQEFFSTPEHPITTKELIDLRKADPTGYMEIAQECAKALGVELDAPKA